MIGSSGIDQEVQSKMDAYRGNPNALAQKYSQNQQLIDLLALQKLKSEKESAAREMQLKMGGQQMPTIAEARENEVLDLTKQELAQQTTGAMQNQQRQKQQAAKDLVERSAQMPMQSPSPMVQGVAGLPAPNMTPKAMATGGIVAFQAGGEPPAPSDEPPVYSDEELRQRILRGEAPPPAASAPQGGGNMSSLARQGIMRLLGGEDPRQVYERRSKEAAEASGYTAEERAIIQKQIADRAAMDAARFNPDRRRSEGLTRWLLGASGRTGIGSVLGGAGAAAVNYDEAMDAQQRQSLVDRQKQEQGLVDVGPAARLAGMKLGSEAEKLATQGLHYGVDAATRLEQAQMAAARSGAGQMEMKRLTAAESRFDNAKRQIFAQMKERNIEPGSPESAPYYQQINEIGQSIYQRMQVPDFFVPDPVPGAPVEPPQQPVLFGRLFGSGTPPSPTGGSAPRAVPFSALPPK